MASVSPTLLETHRALITANHILHHHNVVDGYGHISVRHPEKPSVYVMSGYLAPAVVSNSSDLIEYHVSDSSPVDPNAAKGYSERFIHGELFRRFPGVNSVIHSHSEAVVPFMIGGVELRPVYHMAGFLGPTVPMYDITAIYEPGDRQDMLVNNQRFGSALASHFAAESSSPDSSLPDHIVVLMRHHGFTTIGTSISEAVFRAMYTQTNASLQSTAIMLRNASLQGGVQRLQGVAVDGIDCLNEREMKGSREMNEATEDKAFRGWVWEIERTGFYTNELAKK